VIFHHDLGPLLGRELGCLLTDLVRGVGVYVFRKLHALGHHERVALLGLLDFIVGLPHTTVALGQLAPVQGQ